MIKIENIIVWILFILSVITFFWYLFGNSPTFEQSITIAAMALLFTLALKVGGHGARLFHVERRLEKLDRLEESFIKLGSDFKEYMIKHRD
ncbi:hypothetical protein CMI42_05175 [Candidatus Pacearchaeota archaeon]|nr:hypothetical protein [Candidatus Pacearchaeota archaeon]